MNLCKTGGKICQSRGEIIIFAKQGEMYWNSENRRKLEICGRLLKKGHFMVSGGMDAPASVHPSIYIHIAERTSIYPSFHPHSSIYPSLHHWSADPPNSLCICLSVCLSDYRSIGSPVLPRRAGGVQESLRRKRLSRRNQVIHRRSAQTESCLITLEWPLATLSNVTIFGWPHFLLP